MLSPLVVAIVFMFTVPHDFECLVPVTLIFKIGLALSHVMDVQYYSSQGYNENYCKAAGIVKTFWFDACVLCLTCYVVMFRHKLNYRNDPLTYKNVPVHHLALCFIIVFSGLHAFFSQDVLVVDRINQKDEVQQMFNFYKSNTCLSFGKKSPNQSFDAMDKLLGMGPTILLIVMVVPVLINNRTLLLPENQNVYLYESIKPYIMRHNILILIVLADLIFDSIFNIWIEFLGSKFLSTRTIGRLCQFILLVEIYLLVATYRLHNAAQIQEVNLLSKSESEDDTRYQTASNLGGASGRINGRKPVGQLLSDNNLAPERIVFKAKKDRYDRRMESERGGHQGRGMNNYLEKGGRDLLSSEYEKEDSGDYSSNDIEKEDHLPLRSNPAIQQQQTTVHKTAVTNVFYQERQGKTPSAFHEAYETPRIKDESGNREKIAK